MSQPQAVKSERNYPNGYALAAEYREQAEGCRRMARKAKGMACEAEVKVDCETLLKTAETWEARAHTHEKQAKIAELNELQCHAGGGLPNAESSTRS